MRVGIPGLIVLALYFRHVRDVHGWQRHFNDDQCERDNRARGKQYGILFHIMHFIMFQIRPLSHSPREAHTCEGQLPPESRTRGGVGNVHAGGIKQKFCRGVLVVKREGSSNVAFKHQVFQGKVRAVKRLPALSTAA